MSVPAYHLPAATSDWSTPHEVFAPLNAEFGFNLDAAATPENAKCLRYLTPEENALLHEWHGRVWLNPPYGRRIGLWLAKARAEVDSGNAKIVVCLLPARTDTEWWHQHVEGVAAEVRFIRGRIKFSGGRDAPFPCVLVVYKNAWRGVRI